MFVYMKQIKIPVAIDKKEVLLGSVDTIYELAETTLTVVMRYKYSCHTDDYDDFSAMDDRLVDYKCIILRSAILGINYIWSWKNEKYHLEITTSGNTYSFGVDGKQETIGLMNELSDWWLEK